MVPTFTDEISYHSVINADERLKEIPKLDFAIAAIADYDNGLTQGFRDGAVWAKEVMIDRACEWLEPRIRAYASNGDTSDLIDDFRKAFETL